MIKKQQRVKGFTLLELLIVIAILAILSVALVLILNPAETLKKGRDSQRMSDLSTMKTAIGLYLTTISSPVLDGSGNTLCFNGTGNDSVFYSIAGITDNRVIGNSAWPVSSTGTSIDGSGWLPVNFTQVSGGSPISNLPVDPLNTVADLGNIVNADNVYRYACDANDSTFEINATLESNAFTVDDDKRAKDGGDNPNLYEVGMKLTILGSNTDF